MITFKNLKYRNFLSSGQHWTDINFQEYNTNLVIGTNGSGKSTMLDALTFALFNKPFRKINKSQLINTTNEKDTLVEVEFSVNSRDYLVRRGIKPNIFDIEVNGEALHRQADDRSNQKILEENILKVNYKSFTQIVILGSSTFVPFMQLTGSNRREVIEDLLDIRIFSTMNALMRDKMRVQREGLKTLSLRKDNIQDKMVMQKNFMAELDAQRQTGIKASNKKIKEYTLEVDNLLESNETKTVDVSKLIKEQENVTGAGKKLKKLNTLKGKLSNK